MRIRYLALYSNVPRSGGADMWKRMLTFSVLACSVAGFGITNKVFAVGKWVVDKVDRCPDYQKYPYDVDMRIQSLNDTHGAIFIDVLLLDDITEDGFGISVKICKKTETGCDTMFEIDDLSLCRFMVEHAQENWEDVLTNIGAEKHCPVKKGFYKLTNYIFDSTEFPKEGMCGEYMGKAIVTKHDEENMSDAEILCLCVHVHFDEDYKDSVIPFI